MIYVKSFLMGCIAAVVVSLMWFVGEFALLAFVWVPRGINETGSGGLGAVSMGSNAPLAGVVAFVVGFYLSLRRFRRRINQPVT